mmetsp:Transcript_3730/g.9871  ORF Transcript_3730/g.9871 Transcript_3730/m.9871 type:complete len:86 (+) Transcript_3730:1094-1351(+)
MGVDVNWDTFTIVRPELERYSTCDFDDPPTRPCELFVPPLPSLCLKRFHSDASGTTRSNDLVEACKCAKAVGPLPITADASIRKT